MPSTSEPIPGDAKADAAPGGAGPAPQEQQAQAPSAAGEVQPAEPTTARKDGKLDLRRSRLLSAAAAPAPEAEAEEGAGEALDADARAALKRTVEALLFAGEEPLTIRELARAAGSRSAVVRRLMVELREAYETEHRPWELVEVAGGYRFVTRAEFFPAIQKLKAQHAQRKLTPAALETLALVAYSKEPLGRAEIEAVRGVDTGPVLRQLLERKLVRVAGRGPGLGQPLLYAISQEFLEHFGLKSPQDLPQTGDFKGV